MVRYKIIIYFLILVIFFLGFYEKLTGNILNERYYIYRHGITHMTISGNLLMFLAFFLFIVCSYVFKKY